MYSTATDVFYYLCAGDDDGVGICVRTDCSRVRFSELPRARYPVMFRQGHFILKAEHSALRGELRFHAPSYWSFFNYLHVRWFLNMVNIICIIFKC